MQNMEVTKPKEQTTTANGGLLLPSTTRATSVTDSQNTPHSLAFNRMNSMPMGPALRSGPFLDGYMDSSLDLNGYPGPEGYHRIPGMTPDMHMQGFMPGEGPIEQQPPETFRTEYNGALQGVQSLLQLLYATTGIINFGGIAIKMTYKVIKYLGGGSLKILGAIFNPKHITRLIKVLFSGSRETTNGLSGMWENTAEAGLDAAALGEGASKANKIFFILRVVSLIGAVIAYFLKRRSESILRTMEDKVREQELKEAAEMVVEMESNEETAPTAVGELMTTSEEFWSQPYGSKERLAPLQPKPQPQEYIREELPILKSQYMAELPIIPEMKHAVSEIIEVTPTTTATAGAAAKPWLSRKKSVAKAPETSTLDSLHRSQSSVVSSMHSFGRTEGAYN